MDRTITVGISDCVAVSAEEADNVATYALGSCVGVAVYDDLARTGGILHALLPTDKSGYGLRRDNLSMFADAGVRRLLEMLERKGASIARCAAVVAGGANMLGNLPIIDIGKDNVSSAVTELVKSYVRIERKATGGFRGRSLHLDLRTGLTTVRVVGNDEASE